MSVLWDGEHHPLRDMPQLPHMRTKPLGIPWLYYKPGDYSELPIPPVAPADLSAAERKLLQRFRAESSRWTTTSRQYTVRRWHDGVYRLVRLA